MNSEYIDIKGARANNLKNIDLKLPLGKMTVVTGVSGSGKSSLAFDTLYAEGQRRYVESLSAYARQFLGRMPKPEVDFIHGLPPAIAIEQKVNTRNPRSTVGTSTEIYDYMRMLFARVGRTYSPVSGREVIKHDVEDVMREVNNFAVGSRIAVVVDIFVPSDRTPLQQLEILRKQGYARLLDAENRFVDISGIIEKGEEPDISAYKLVIDRLAVSEDKDEQARMAEAVETAFYEGHDECSVVIWHSSSEVERLTFSKSFSADGITFREPSDLMFNFNNPYGACPECEGFGSVLGISEDLVIPDKSLSVYGDAVAPWRGPTMKEWKDYLIRVAGQYSFPIHTPYEDLTPEQKEFLWKGNSRWEGIDGFWKWVDKNQYKVQYRVMKARYRGKATCPMCHGSRLHQDVEYVRIDGHSITELVRMPVSDLLPLMRNLKLDEREQIVAKRLLTEIVSRLDFLEKVGLGYLTLDRRSNTLSGGESQRINLVTSLGSSLVGSLYILDEPSIGLHPRDTGRLIKVLHDLRDLGNTVVVVEHDDEIMRSADHLVDIGPDAGRLGGELVWDGPVSEIASVPQGVSHTADYLNGTAAIQIPAQRRVWKHFIDVKGATEHNLKKLDVRIPMGIMTVVTGVSGSGKSTLVRDILFRGLAARFDSSGGTASDTGRKFGAFKSLDVSMPNPIEVVFVDQNPIGTSSRSNVASYLGVYDSIRQLMASRPLAKQMGMTPGFFSFNSEGGRCPNCQGEGSITIEMQFMADLKIECEECHGKRFTRDVLDVEYNGKNIYDILEMTVDEAMTFFAQDSSRTAAKILAGLQPLHDVGLGYVKLGQPSSTFSGGENQRVKLAYFLSKTGEKHHVFIFDEPTTGLHPADISKLLDSLNRLIAKGHSVIVIEHNLDVIASADYVIDLGPEGGEDGGNLVVAGTPEEVAQCEKSYTGKYLKSRLS